MKKVLFILLSLSLSHSYADSDTCYVNARNYVDTYITQNSVRSITGTILNTALNKIINSIYCLDTSTTSGTVTSVATDATLTGGTITTTGTLKVDTSLISTKNYALNIGNTKATFSALSDTASALNTRINAKGTVTSVATGVGLSGGTITGSGTIVADTASTLVTKTFLTSSLSGIGVGASLSGLTAATATNNISNTNYKQRWNWNTIAGDTAFVLESVSTTAASNLQNVFTVKISGANATSTQTTYAQRISNTHTGTSSTNVGLEITASGATNNYALLATGRVGIGVSAPSHALDVNGDIRTSNVYRFSGVSTILEANGGLNLTGAGVIVSSSNTGGIGMGYQFRTIGSDLISQTSLNMPTVGSKFSLAFGTSYINGGYLKLNANPVIIENSSGNIIFYSNTGLTVDATGYTPTEIIRFKSDGSIGVGTNSPAASAKLDLTSTTQGFLPPRMTATQASAISSPAKALMIYVTDTNGTFTSAGWWGYNGTIWKLILAE